MSTIILYHPLHSSITQTFFMQSVQQGGKLERLSLYVVSTQYNIT